MKIICIGRNFHEHITELNSKQSNEPIFFLKPNTALLCNNEPFYYPNFTKQLHYECEVVVKICKHGKNIQEKFANKYYQEISLGIDFTARDLQQKCKENGTPWEISKAFEHSAPLSPIFINKTQIDLYNLNFSLHINKKCVQEGNTKDWIYSIDAIIAYVSQFIPLKMGDLIFTGTPSGVGEVRIGDRLEGYIEKNKMFDFEIK